MATHALPKRDVDRLPMLSPPTFVGRDRELAALENALARPPALVLVEGEAGIGKSRLVQEFLAARVAGEERVLVGACPPFREPQTLGPIVDAIRRATDTVTGLRLTKLAGALRPLFPEWVDDLPPSPEPAEDPTAARHRLFRALTELLDGLRTVLLVVEDAHWADEATLEFLLFLTSRRDPHLSLVVTYRPEDLPADSLLRRLSSRLPVGTAQLRLTLPPLDVSATADLVTSMLAGERVSDEFGAFLRQRTDGVPLAIEESVRVMCDRADLIRRNGEWVRWHLADIEVPPTIRDSVLERVDRLSPAAQRVLRAAAVLADPAKEAAVLAVAGPPIDEDRVGLNDALVSGLLHEDVRGRLSFRHVLSARAVYEAMSGTDRRLLHLRAGEVLEGYTPQPVARLARHFREAGDTDRWCRCAEQAADTALASGDEASAAMLLHDLVVDAVLPAADVARLAGKIPLGRFGGDFHYQDLIQVLRRVLDAPGLAPLEEAEVRYQLGRTLTAADDRAAGRVELEAALLHLAHNTAAAARAMTLLGLPVGRDGTVEEHLRWLRRAARVALRPGSVDYFVALTNRVSALLRLGSEEGWAEAARIPEDAPTGRCRLQITNGNLNIGEEAMLWGRYEEASRRLSVAVNLADQHEYARLRNAALTARVHLDWLTGTWSGLLARTETLAVDSDTSGFGRLECDLVLALLRAANGRSGQATGELQEVLAELGARAGVPYVMEPAAALARLWLRDGRVDDALDVTDEPMSIVARKGVWLWAADLTPARVEALVASGRLGEAGDLVAAFARGLRGRNAPAPKAGLVLCRALLAKGKGEYGRAAAAYARAAASWEALPRPYDALLAREQQARCLLAAGRSEDGLGVLSQVFEGLYHLGARGDADRVMRILHENGVRPRRGAVGRPSYGDRLSPRELEAVQMLVTGHKDREIAESLHLSPRTVSFHLDSARRKLKVHSRTALAVAAVDAGLVSGPSPAQRS